MKPLFEETCGYSMTIAGDETDVHLPQLHEKEPTHITFPVALFLQGFDVDKSCYSQFAKRLAGYGFIVLVPNHRPSGRPFLAPELHQIPATLAYLNAESRQSDGSLTGKFDLQRVMLLGHSCGGLTGLKALQQASSIPHSGKHDASSPPRLGGGVFYGSQLTGVHMRKKRGIAVAFIAGSLDGIVPSELTKQTYQRLQSVPKAYMTIKGANHYGITDMAQPPNGPEEKHQPLLEQHVSIHRIAHWSAVFLRAYVLKDHACLEYFSRDDCENETKS